MELAEQLREAVESIKIEEIDGSEVENEELAKFLMDNPAIIEFVEDDDADEFVEVMEFLDEIADISESLPSQEQMFSLLEKTGKKHDPFKRKSSLTVDAAIYGHQNPRDNVNNWDCDCSNFKCSCKNTDTGATKRVNMSKYYSSGRKAKYMDGWREITGGGKKKK